jgi:hypothetical protein
MTIRQNYQKTVSGALWSHKLAMKQSHASERQYTASCTSGVSAVRNFLCWLILRISSNLTGFRTTVLELGIEAFPSPCGNYATAGGDHLRVVRMQAIEIFPES